MMKINFKRICAIAFLSVMGVLVLLNYAISEYMKNQAETVGSKLFEGEVSVGSVAFYYYPLAVTFNNVNIKKNKVSSPLKSVQIKHLHLEFDYNSLSLLPDLIFINYARIIEPEITYSYDELGISNPADEALKVCSIDSLKLKVTAADANEEKQAEVYNQDLKQFIITKLFINKAKFILTGDSSSAGKETKVEIADTAIDIVDNLSGKMVEEHLKELVMDALKPKLPLKQSLSDKKINAESKEVVKTTDKKEEIKRNIFE